MPPPVNIKGLRFGRLVALRVTRRKGIRTWLCKCDCGRVVTKTADEMRRGVVQSCGCLRDEKASKTSISRRMPNGLALFHCLIRQYQCRAEKKGLLWELTEDQAYALMVSDCWYCGNSPCQIKRQSGRWGEFKYNGIDRRNNQEGYTVENSVPCCKFCNYAKGARSDIEFLIWIKKVQEHRNHEKTN